MLNLKKLLTKMLPVVQTKSGSGTVANATLKTADTMALGAGKWLVFSNVTFTSGVSGNSQGQNRLTVNNVLLGVRWVADKDVTSPPNLALSNGSETIDLSVFVYAGGSSNGYKYNLYAIRIA